MMQSCDQIGVPIETRNSAAKYRHHGVVGGRRELDEAHPAVLPHEHAVGNGAMKVHGTAPSLLLGLTPGADVFPVCPLKGSLWRSAGAQREPSSCARSITRWATARPRAN